MKRGIKPCPALKITRKLSLSAAAVTNSSRPSAIVRIITIAKFRLPAERTVSFTSARIRGKCTAAGVLFGKLLCFLTKGKINPLIGSAGVSAVPMAARVSQKVGAEADPTNFLLMHAMGPNVAGVIGTAVAAGTFMAVFGV